MTRALALLAVLALAPLSSGCSDAAASPRQLLADQVLRATGPASEFNLFLLLNGEPSKLGVLTSSGSSVDNTTTAVPFTVTAGQVLLFKCDTGQANVGGGSSCDTTVTGANHKYQIANAWDPFYMVLNSATICLDAPAATTINCAVFKTK